MTETVSTLAQAESLLSQGLLTQARALLEAAVEAEPSDTRLRFALGTCLNVLGERTAAILHLGAVVRAVPAHTAAAYELGRALQAVGRFADAVSAFRLALSQGHIPDAVEQLRVCQAALGQPLTTDGFAPAEPSSPGQVAQPSAGTSNPPDLQVGSPAAAATPPSDPAAPLQGTLAARPASLPHTLADNLDATGTATPGDFVWSTRTKPRHNVPTAVVATLVLVVALVLTDLPIWVKAALGLYAAAAWVALVVASAMSHITFYQRRLDISHGFPQKRVVVWYASMVEVGFHRTTASYLTNTASLRIDYSTTAGTHSSLMLDGIGWPARIDELFRELQGPVIRERRAMKKILTT